MTYDLMNGDELSGLWTQIESWLARHAPGDFATLNAGASDQEIERLASGLGFPVHPDLRWFLGVRGGCRPPGTSMDPGAFFLGFTLLDIDGILTAHRELVDIVDESVAWVPLAQDFTGDIVFVDHREGFDGAVGIMSFGDPEPTHPWPSLASMLQDMMSALRSGAALASVPALTPRVHEERMVQWEIHA
ncbi:SMI1/KNR4 family protein [Streptomyces sp. NPDC051322]|uniref:SMI1/KNR4 family protein n=1 Tax=Streptomyces sp. NPDC051322 TaxID=3154645 RepID=UPI003450CED0